MRLLTNASVNSCWANRQCGMTWRSTVTYAGLQNFVVYRISATLQLLFFFFCAVFLLPPRHFYIKNGIHALDTVSSNPFLQSCGQVTPSFLSMSSRTCIYRN